MKRNRKWQAYGRRVIRMIKSTDFEALDEIKERLLDITIFVEGLKGLIRSDVVTGTGEDATFDYNLFDRRSRSYISRLESNVAGNYKVIDKAAAKIRKRIFFTYRRESNEVLNKTGVDTKDKSIEEANHFSATFGGSPTQSFTKHVRNQLVAGLDPGALIKTVSQEHVALIQRQLLTTVSKGRGLGWGADKVLKEIYPKSIDSLIRKRTEQNVTRIMRSSYMQAVNLDTTEFVSSNTDLFYGSRRTADGRPCPACMAQDGDFYEPGRMLIDHPNGQCVLVPLPYPDEFLFDGVITGGGDDVFDVPLTQTFYQGSQAVKATMMTNKSLLRLWNEEKFDYDKVVTGKFGTPISFQKAATTLDELGGISAPRVSFFSIKGKTALNKIIDPKDRSAKGFIVTRSKPVGGDNSFGLNINGIGDDIFDATSKLPESLKAQINAIYGNEFGPTEWYSFNERARLLNLQTRMDIKGNFYYMVSKNRANTQLKK